MVCHNAKAPNVQSRESRTGIAAPELPCTSVRFVPSNTLLGVMNAELEHDHYVNDSFNAELAELENDAHWLLRLT